MNDSSNCIINLNYMPALEWHIARIPKKSGGVRILHIPGDDLKEVQRKILEYLYTYEELRPAACACGFVPGRGALSGVTQHEVQAEVVINMDIKDFFDNVQPRKALDKMLAYGVPAAILDYIQDTCTYKGTFPQGSPASPYLTNIAMQEFDCAMMGWSHTNHYMYTRYADDITISYTSQRRGDDRPYTIIRTIEGLLKKICGLRVNRAKTRVAKINGMLPREVTGVVIRNDALGFNAPRKYRDKIRAMCNNLYKECQAHPENIPNLQGQWKTLLGSVQYMDGIRVHSVSEEGSTADPRVPADQWNYLKSVFMKHA